MHRRLELLRLLYDPLAYYRPWAKVAMEFQPAQRSALNAWLCQKYQLPAYSAVADAHASLTTRLVQGWGRLPITVYLMACAKHRPQLLASRQLLHQSVRVQNFLRLPFAASLQPLTGAVEQDRMQAWGWQYLHAGLRDQMPAWLLTRMSLYSVGLPTEVCAETEEFDFACFWSAWNYAANLS